MKINKQNIIAISIVLLFLLSCTMLFQKLFGYKTTICTLETKDTQYQRQETITLQYKKKTVKKIIFAETFTTDNEDILHLKQTEYEENGYQVKSSTKKLKAKKEKKGKVSYQDTVDTLGNEGYTCK